MSVKGILQFVANRAFYTLIANPTNAEIHMTEQMIIDQLSNTLSIIVDPEVRCQQS